MYLIDAATKKLERFNDERSAPPYAILSHTWGSEEVIIQDLREFHARGSSPHDPVALTSGYEKIARTCLQALKEGINYVWIDTCCIEKTSSADLSEAINRMFLWYKHAKVCYAYINDVHMGPDGIVMHEKSKSSSVASLDQDGPVTVKEEELAKSRWFTRGWALQELIAPKVLKFFTREWKYMGDKASLQDKLERITGISRYALQGADLNTFSIAKRMSWASHRVTTRPEDIAYCLLGIFDVNLPLLYGEGEKAFVRLQEEIMKDSTDQSLFAWSPSRGADGDESQDPADNWKGTSILARHPICFAESGHIQPRSGGSSARETAYALTNRGVKIDLLNRQFTFPCPAPERLLFRLVFLDCTSGDTRSGRVGIVLQQLDSDYPNQWMRHRAADLAIYTSEYQGKAKFEHSTMYLCKKLPLWTTSDMVTSGWERTVAKETREGQARCRLCGVGHDVGNVGERESRRNAVFCLNQIYDKYQLAQVRRVYRSIWTLGL